MNRINVFILLQIKIFCEHPQSRRIMEQKLEIHKDTTLKDAVSVAHKVWHITWWKKIFFYILLTSIRHSTDAENYKLKFDYESEECGILK